MINKFKDFIQLLKNKFSRNSPEENTPPHGLDLNEDSDLNEIQNPTITDKAKNFLYDLKEKFKNIDLSYFKFKFPNLNSFSSSKLNLSSPKLGQFFDKFLDPSSRSTMHQLFLVTFISTASYGLGKIGFIFLAGHPYLDNPNDYAFSIDLENIFQANSLNKLKTNDLFKTKKGLQKGSGAEVKCETAQVMSNLPIKLVNTVVMQDSIKSIASVQVRDEKKLEQIREGEQISNFAKVFKIDRLQILIKNLETGLCESIVSNKMNNFRGGKNISIMSSKDARKFLQSKKISGIENQGNKFKINKSFLDEKLKDLTAILSQARAIKIQNPDGSLSFKLTEMDPQGIFPYLGLQDEDIITSINGKPIYDINEIMGLFGKIKNLDNLSLGVRRDGSDSVQEYSIKK